jgi:hypothetical protein
MLRNSLSAALAPKFRQQVVHRYRSIIRDCCGTRDRPDELGIKQRPKFFEGGDLKLPEFSKLDLARYFVPISLRRGFLPLRQRQTR